MSAARQRKKGLSERQTKILEVLDRFNQDFGYPPSIRDICDKAGVSSTSVVNYYLDQLEEMGYIERDQHRSRGIRLVKPLADTLRDILHIPMVGRIFAAEPVPIPGISSGLVDAESMIDVARSMLPPREKGEGLFALEVRGDSMIDAMVNDGDIVIMKQTNEARNGEMVAVWLKDMEETTLKYFYLENGRIRLQPANPTMKPIYKDPSIVEVQGKVVMVIRSVGNQPLQ